MAALCRRLVAAAVSACAFVCCLPLGAAPALTTTAPAVERQATLVFKSRGIKLSPKRLKSVDGETVIVVFWVRNATTVGRRFVVGSYRSPLVRPGGTQRYSVAFVHAGSFTCRAVPGRGKAFTRTLRISA